MRLWLTAALAMGSVGAVCADVIVGAKRMKGYGLMSAKPDLFIDVSISFPGHAPLHAQFKPLDQTGRLPTPR